MKFTEKQVNTFNKAINNYSAIESDGELNKQKLSYSDYQRLGYLLDSIRYEGKAETIIKGAAEWFRRQGLTIERTTIGYKITL